MKRGIEFLSALDLESDWWKAKVNHFGCMMMEAG
jgi:hypothetical protein